MCHGPGTCRLFFQVKPLLFLLAVIPQFLRCTEILCPAPFDVAFPVENIRSSISSIEEVVARDGDENIVVAQSLDDPLAVQVSHSGTRGEELLASIPPLFPSNLSRSVISTPEGWWLSRQGGQGSKHAVFFVHGGERLQMTRVEVPPHRYPLVWLPLEGADPRGVLISAGNAQPSLLMDEVTPAGVKPLASFSWWQPTFQQTLAANRWSAEVLNDGRIAVIGVDGPPGEEKLTMRILGEGEPVDSVLLCEAELDGPIATAVDGANRVAVVGLSKSGDVVALFADVDAPGAARCLRISASEETAAKPPFGTPAVVWDGRAFVAAWISDEGRVLAAELGALRANPRAIEVGRGAATERTLHQLIQVSGETLTLVWRDRGGSLVRRRIPESFTGYLVADGFCDRLKEPSPFSWLSFRARSAPQPPTRESGAAR